MGFVPWGPESIAPVLAVCPGCGFELTRPPTEEELVSGIGLGQSAVAWRFEPRTLCEVAKCPACGRRLLQSRLEASRGHDFFRTVAGDSERQALERARCQAEPWYWIVNYVVTEDRRWLEKDLDGPYQRFPPYLYLRSSATRLWRERYTAWPKSRQMLYTWLISAWTLGETLFVPGRLTLIQSKKELDAQDVLRRIRGIVTRLEEFAPWMLPRIVDDRAGRLGFANDSAIIAMPEGAHHVQSYTPSRLVLDEVQLQDEAEEAYHQALPACEQITLIGSPEWGWFWEMFLPDKLLAANP